LQASAERAGAATPFARFCIALALAGAAGALISLVQVFAPHLADGNWIAVAALAGALVAACASRHLSSLLLWSVVAVIWLGEARDARRARRGRADARLRLRDVLARLAPARSAC
jgi:hypothetical protein